MIEEETIRAIVVRLARPSGSRTGTHVVERAAILAEGSDCAEIEAWILREGGEPCSDATVSQGRGLYAERANSRSAAVGAAPSRYTLPASAFTVEQGAKAPMEAAGIEPARPEQTGAARR
jgi:hypothetical protein